MREDREGRDKPKQDNTDKTGREGEGEGAGEGEG
jgi:hypothetical protein